MIEVSEPLPAAISASSHGAELGIGGERRAAVGDHLVDVAQVGAVVVAQPLGLVVDDGLELRHLLRHGQDLVDLLLILHRGELHLGVGEHIGELVRHRVGVDRNRHRAERLRRHHRSVNLRPVGADDGDGVAAPHAKPVQADRIGAHLVEQARPGPGLPDAHVLVTQRRPVAERAGVAHQQLRKGVRLRVGAGNRLEFLWALASAATASSIGRAGPAARPAPRPAAPSGFAFDKN